MSSTRTQVYLTAAQRERIDRVATASGLSMAEVIRRALEAYLDEVAPDPAGALAATFGALPDLAVPDRDEWDRG
jgi:hypothetical protein